MIAHSKRLVLALALLAVWMVGLPGPAAASVQETQASSNPETDRFNGKYLEKFGLDFGHIVTSPLRWQSEDWLTFAAIAGTGIVLYAYDRALYDAVQKGKNKTSEAVSPYVRIFGNGVYLGVIIAGMYGAGEIFEVSGLRKTALLSLESFLTTSAVVWAFKVAAGRARPSTGESSSSFHPFSFSTAHTSFPSGDAAAAFSVATVIADRTDNLVVDVLVYGLAGFVAFYRVHDSWHWPSDVLIGSALGYFVAKKVCRLNERRSAQSFHVGFDLSGTRQAVTLNITF